MKTQDIDDNELRSVCIIPARKGSKRIKNKNIRMFRGRPMIEWSIMAARSSGCFSRIVVSTDSQEISSIALELGAEVPFVRPPHLSDDFAGTREVVIHAIDELNLRQHGQYKVCCLYATAPFVSSFDIARALEYLIKSRSETIVFAATSFSFPIQRAIRIDSDGYSSAFDPVSASKRSQDLDNFYHDAGQFYWACVRKWCDTGNLFDEGRPLLLPRWRVQDIDTEEDWMRAELMHAVLEQESLIV